MTPTTVLSFGEYMPDQPDYANPGISVATNVLPRTQQTYGPMSAQSAYSSNGLNTRCQGALATLDSGGDVSVIAGDGTDLYQLVPGSLAFDNVSKSAAAYTTDSGGIWSMAQFGQDVLASDFNDPIQAFTLNSSTDFADLGGTPPKAKYIAVVKNFVMLGFTNEAIDGVSPQRVWWSGINQDNYWPTPGTSAALAVQSDFQDIPGNQGWLMGLVPNLGFADCAVFFQRAVYRMQYIGAPYFFALAPALQVRGTPSPNSLVQLGAVVYYLGEDGFYAFDGSNAVPIGALKVDKFFSADLDSSYFDRVCGAVDPINKIVFWAYPGSGSTNGTPNRMLAYHTVLNRWSLVDGISTDIIFRALSIGYTLTQLSPGLYATMEDIPFPLDSRVWAGGASVLGGFDGTSHKLGYFNGSNMAVTIETSEGQPFPGRRGFINNSRPIIDAGSPTVSIGQRNRTVDAVTYGSPIAMNSNGECPQRSAGRYFRGVMAVPAATAFNHIQGVEVQARPEGQR